jgi:hypothetical protein
VTWTEELETLDPLHYSPVDVDRGVLGPLFPVVYDQLLCLADVEGEVVESCRHTAYHSRVISKLNDGVGVVRGYAIPRPLKVIYV